MKRTISLVLLVLALFALVAGGMFSPAMAGPGQATATPGEPEIEPVNPTPTSMPPVGVKTPPPGGGSINGTPVAPPKVKLPPTLDDLLKQFPDLQPYLEKAKDLNIGDAAQLAELYSRIVQIYQGAGASGVATFLKDSGILDKLNIPLTYLDLLIAYDDGGADAVTEMARERQIINNDNEIVGFLALDDQANLEAVRERLTRLGVTVYDWMPDTEEVEIGVPLGLLATYQTPGSLLGYFALVANTEHVVGFRVPAPVVRASTMRPGTTALDVLAQTGGDTGIDLVGATAWHDAGVTGEGVKLGILSYGWEGISDMLGSELPEADAITSNVELDELNEDQGILGLITAISAYRAAPGATLVIATYDPSSFKTKQAAMQFLADEEVKIVLYPSNSLIGPRDGTSVDTQMVEEFVRETGVLWVNSAGNQGAGHTAFEFNPGEGGVHAFSEEANLMPFQAYGNFAVVALNWNGNWNGGEKTEYIFKVLDKDQNEVVTAAEPRRGKKNQYPYQVAAFETEPGEIYYLLVARTKGTTDNVMDVFVTNSALPEWALVAENSVLIPADGDSVVAVGATNLEDKLMLFSGQGPTVDGRMKPELVAPTGDAMPGFDDGFYNTITSAGIVAGAGALASQQFADLSGPEIKAFLSENVEDLGDSGPDNQFGAGRLLLPEPGEVDPDKPKGKGVKEPSNEPAATITNVTAKFNVKVKGKKGVAVNVSFDLENYKGKTIGLLAVFFDAKGEPIEPKDEKFSVAVGEDVRTVGGAAVFNVKSSQTAFEDVPIFIPNSAFGTLKSGTQLMFRVLIIDATDKTKLVRLAISDPVGVKVK